MLKQEVLQEIADRLKIRTDGTFFSTGSTITKSALIEIINKLSEDDIFQKQDLFRAICAGLEIEFDDSWCSTGSTITKDGWSAILTELDRRGIN